jgi:hypothetical protein
MSVADLRRISRRRLSFLHIEQRRKGAPLGFWKGDGGLTISDRAPVLGNRPPLTDAPVPKVALTAPVGPRHPSPEGERIPASSQRRTMADLGELVDLSQRCSSPVLLGNFVSPGEHFGNSLRGHRPCYPFQLCGRWRLHPWRPEGTLQWEWKIVSLTNTEFEKGNWNFSTPRACPWVGGTSLLHKSHTHGMTVFVIPLFPHAR